MGSAVAYVRRMTSRTLGNFDRCWCLTTFHIVKTICQAVTQEEQTKILLIQDYIEINKLKEIKKKVIL